MRLDPIKSDLLTQGGIAQCTLVASRHCQKSLFACDANPATGTPGAFSPMIDQTFHQRTF
jgi:hypothetical protein